MKILHYSLGFPPYRTGGLVKFCIDLMQFQVKNGIDVAMIWPGRLKIFNKKTDIIEKIDSATKLKSFELINPLPVPLDEGIIDFELYTQSKKIDDYERILRYIKPDYIHIHTLMGMPFEFIKAAKNLKIKTIFTTHDYFGICPKVNLYYNNSVCLDNDNCKNCFECNKKALSKEKVIILQSPIYRILKNSKVIKWLRKKHRNNFFHEIDKSEQNDFLFYNSDKYVNLREYYLKFLNEIDIIHFNSELSKKIYSRYIEIGKSKIIHISHLNIDDNRKIREYSNDKVKITYMASVKPYKGFGLLKSVLEELWDENKKNFVFNVYADIEESDAFIDVKGKYTSKDLPQIFDNTDILVVPSIWYETYGYTVLEAISYGVPVIVSENVGSKDIIGNAGIIVKANDKASLKKALEKVLKDEKYLKKMNMETFNCNIPKMQDMLKILEENDG